jgi:PIN domain nuclease of toxin-antitoxin system
MVVTMLHARRVFALPLHHRHPFDRMLVAQALEEGLTVVTRDPSFAAYRIPTAWG